MSELKKLLKDFYFNADIETIEKANDLRKRITRAEAILWEKLRNRKLAGLKFRRQHPVEIYIVDFFCFEKMLAIEVDGKIHLKKEQMEWDENRTREIGKYGIKILRFTNEEIENEIIKVLMKIKKECFSHLTPIPLLQERGKG